MLWLGCNYSLVEICVCACKFVCLPYAWVGGWVSEVVIAE